jgi:hypothetical protein
MALARNRTINTSTTSKEIVMVYPPLTRYLWFLHFDDQVFHFCDYDLCSFRDGLVAFRIPVLSVNEDLALRCLSSSVAPLFLSHFFDPLSLCGERKSMETELLL